MTITQRVNRYCGDNTSDENHHFYLHDRKIISEHLLSSGKHSSKFSNLSSNVRKLN